MSSTLTSMPNELQLNILTQLPIDDIVNICLVSSHFRSLFALHHKVVLRQAVKNVNIRLRAEAVALDFKTGAPTFVQCLITWDSQYGLYHLFKSKAVGTNTEAEEQFKALVGFFAEHYIAAKGAFVPAFNAFRAKAQAEGRPMDWLAVSKLREKLKNHLIQLAALLLDAQRLSERSPQTRGVGKLILKQGSEKATRIDEYVARLTKLGVPGLPKDIASAWNELADARPFGKSPDYWGHELWFMPMHSSAAGKVSTSSQTSGQQGSNYRAIPMARVQHAVCVVHDKKQMHQFREMFAIYGPRSAGATMMMMKSMNTSKIWHIRVWNARMSLEKARR